MTLSHIAARGVGFLCVAIFAGAGAFSLASLYRDISTHWDQILDPWRDMIDAAAARWRAIAVLFPVPNGAGDRVDAAHAAAETGVEVR